MPPLISLLAIVPRRLLAGAAIALSLATHAAAYRLGAAHEFRAGFAAGESAAAARQAAAASRRTARQIEDRLNAETAPPSPPGPDGLRCGPSARDCPR